MSTDLLVQNSAEGQFDDAPDTSNNVGGPTTIDPRSGATFIDDALLEWSEPEDGGVDLEDGLQDEEYNDDRPEDEDWEVAERDFTKQYNRLKQHIAVRSGVAEGSLHATSKSNAAVASLPAVNRPRQQQVASQLDKTKDQLAALSKFSSRISKIDLPYQMGASVNRKGPSAHANIKDKSDRATNEQVLDPRTRIILFKMIGRGLVYEINGCVSTGKEANVYHAVSPEQKHLAMKIYKTSILVFKDRDRYVTGEHRFRRGYSRHNPRKMVRMWAEKEMRNLRRLVSAGIPCPEPMEVRENVLVMTFLGDAEGWASPRLKDASIDSLVYPRLYRDLLLSVRRMFHTCRLVHADLSEYNILYHADTLYIIDVSQSVEHDHPHAFDFLRKDLSNVEDFFGRFGVSVLGLRRAFEFITTESVDNTSEEQLLDRYLEEGPLAEEDDDEDANTGSRVENKHEDAVFMQSYIPRNLNEVFDPERDVAALNRGEGQDLIYKDTIGLVHADARVEEGNGASVDGFEDSEDDDESDESDTDEDGEGKARGDRKPRGHRHEGRDDRKARKQAVKEEAREKRKTKMKKADKKRKVKVTKRG